MKFSKSLTQKEKSEYILICQKIWGCVPVDIDWATETDIYKKSLLIAHK